MDIYTALEDLRAFILSHDLPRTEMALFGIRCPYCGKSDRIRKLEAPEHLDGILEPKDIDAYADLWRRLEPSSDLLGICKFCRNPVQLFSDPLRAEVIETR
ncbi:MAG: hypothetical protein K9K82_07745 [Desulfobacteraceae bacterium]|nr:hypothetical protein [Desulfobacteraceae bacterium]